MEICTTLIAISPYLEAKFDYRYFIIDYSYSMNFLRYGSKILHKKFQVILSKKEGVAAIFPNFDLILNLKINVMPLFLLERLEIVYGILEP